ncbi:hypothetical protein PFICI_09316 [Pestalotiopsis fici W106-1]|uniref:Glycoside hydrolase n=1 Tax=Pestalotiopsis fici (strain W106-1 / CGMCC3.15140) TaxID=1229662 RepID=W3X002_PESFW|nr:uncharacterized protein PFICI_09316 [Pestalotiopsis fici W106-1]ETS79463.1 hypothetical protein PFICI_09316 [Pestalotiopsis fici W106-1]
MGVQVPDEALGTVVGVLIFSLLCLTCSILMIWLVWVHHERDSFVAMIGYFTFLSTITSIIQQLHTMILWDDVKTVQWEHARANIGSVEVAVAGPSVGLDLVLFYIQYFSYNVEALLTLFWAGALAQSIYGFADIAAFKRVRRRANGIAKLFAVVMPATLISLLQLPSVRSSFTGFLVVANINMILSLTLGALLLLAILIKYIHTRRQFLSWNVQYGNSTKSSQGRRRAASNRQSVISERPRSIYDQWLMTRFAITFIMLSIFELFLIMFQVSSARTTIPADAPDLSADKAKSDFVLFMPGCLPGVLLFVVFGTTTPFRDHMRKTFLPKRFQNKMTTPTDAGADQVALATYSSQNGKSLRPSIMTDDGPLTPTDATTIIQLREVELHRNSTRKDDDDEWPILATTTRVNNNVV